MLGARGGKGLLETTYFIPPKLSCEFTAEGSTSGLCHNDGDWKISNSISCSSLSCEQEAFGNGSSLSLGVNILKCWTLKQRSGGKLGVGARQAAARAVHWHSSSSHPGHCIPRVDADCSVDSVPDGWGLPKFLTEDTERFMPLPLVKCNYPAAVLLRAQLSRALTLWPWALWTSAQPGAFYSPWLCGFKSSCRVPGTVFCVVCSSVNM